VLAALAPIVVMANAAALSALIVLGVLLALTGLWSLGAPGSIASEYIHIVIGVLLFISPWVLGYSALAGAAWTSWIAGVLAVVIGLSALPAANAAHHGLAGQH
jgi:hypothetical protein